MVGERRDRVVAVLIALALSSGLLLVGGAIPLGARITCLLSLLTVLPYLSSRGELSRVPPLLIVLLALIAATLAQLIPLPVSVVAFLSPTAASTMADSLRALGQTQNWQVLSLEPGNTLLHATQFAGYLALAYSSLRLATRRRGRRTLAATVVVLALALVACGSIHMLFGADTLFGLYSPKTFSPAFLTPLINPNHLAGFLAMAACVAMGLAFDASAGARLRWAAATACLAGVCLYLNSRAAAIALVLGLMVAAGLNFVRMRHKAREHRRESDTRFTIAGAVAATLIALLLVSGLATNLSTTSASEFSDPQTKFGAWSSSLSVLRDFSVSGIGRGAFETVFTRYHEPSALRIYSHVENEYLQILLDYGVVVGGLLLGLMGWLVWRTGQAATRSPVAAGTLGGLTVIGIQNLADFSLEFSGVASVALVLFATLANSSMAPAQHRRRMRLLRISALCSGAVLLLLSTAPVGGTTREDRALVEDSLTTADEPVAAAGPMVSRHPADFFLLAEVGRHIADQDPGTALRLVNRALFLHQSHGPTHHLAARLLRGMGQEDQALIEYGLALTHTGDPEQIARDIAAGGYRASQLERHLGVPGARVRGIAAGLKSAGRGDLALAAARGATRRDPSSAQAWNTLAQSAMDQNEYALAAEAADSAYKLDGSVESLVLGADALLKSDNPKAALANLERALAHTLGDERARVLLRIAAAKIAAEDLEGAAEAAFQVAAGLGGRKLRAKAFQILSKIERLQGNTHRSRWQEEQAQKLLSP